MELTTSNVPVSSVETSQFTTERIYSSAIETTSVPTFSNEINLDKNNNKNDLNEVNVDVNVEVTNKNNLDSGTIGGIFTGGIICVALIVVGIFILIKRMKRYQRNRNHNIPQPPTVPQQVATAPPPSDAYGMYNENGELI